jgi:hypothetical protein
MSVTPANPLIIRRWYDTRPTIKQAVGLMPKFPHAFQTIMAEGIITIADKQYRAEQRLNELKTLGNKLIMALYKANQKQRKMDHTAELFQLNRYLMILPADKSDALSVDMLKLMTLIGRYIRFTNSFKQQPETGIVGEITNVFTYRGEIYARQILDDLEMQTQPVETISALPVFNQLAEIGSDVAEDRLIAISSVEPGRYPA